MGQKHFNITYKIKGLNYGFEERKKFFWITLTNKTKKKKAKE